MPENYHHGDLKEACLKEARKLLESGGIDAISMRVIATKTGVSPRAPYRHFADRLELLAQLAEGGFREFSAAMKNELKKVGDGDQEARFVAIAKGYVEFAIENSKLMELMFSETLSESGKEYPQLQKVGAEALEVLTDQAEPLSAKSDHSKNEIAIVAWSIVHGYAALARQKRFKGLRKSDSIRSDVRLIADIFLHGSIQRRSPRAQRT